MNATVTAGDLRRPLISTQLQAFILFCQQQTHRSFADYTAFDTFCADQFHTFWSLFLEWSQIICEGDAEPICSTDDCETAVFFPALRLNYAENILHGVAANAVIGCHADGSRDVLTRDMLRQHVIQFAGFLRERGVQPGDIVAAIARSNIEMIIAALASAAIGAIFSSCAHDMGTFTILTRFQKLTPKILLANCASQPWDVGKPLKERISEVIAGLPSLTAVITLDGTLECNLPVYDFTRAIVDASFAWQRFPFNHPLLILFSSGTTGTPKCIMHGAGGTLLEHIKEHRLHGDLDHRDRMYFQTTCGWMMWNWQLSALACGAEVVVYDGPLKGPETLWQIVADQQVTVFGSNPAYLQFTEASGFAPHTLDLSALRSILSTGSILYPRLFDWITDQVKPVAVQSISGGTDILGCFVLGNPLLPVQRGQAQCRSLGLDVRSLTDSSSAIGELICANPFPSRPIGFYAEPTVDRYHEAYFAQNPGVWTHGDLIEFTPHGAILHGRSDGVMNIRGVRIGPDEIYRILQLIPTIIEAMAVEQTDEHEAGGARLILLVVLRARIALDHALIVRIRTLLVEQGNAMMVPAAIIQVRELPVTHSGKRSEAAARDAVNGRAIRNRAALLNPDCLDGLMDKAVSRPAISEPIEVGERSLCEICQRYLNIPIIHPTDNFLMLGGDSLAILGFLMEVSRRTKTSLPLQTLIGVSTVQELTRLLSGKSSPHARTNHNTPQIRPVEPRDEAAICRLLDEGFRRSLPWNRILNHPWQPEELPRGLILTVVDEIVGFIGLVGATRVLNGKSGTVCNLSSWYVRPEYRGRSNALMAAATQFDGITFTSLTPGKASNRILRAMGFSALDDTKLYLPPLMQAMTLGGPRSSLTFAPITMRQMISSEQQQILDDHARDNCLPALVIEGDEMAFVMIQRRLYRRKFPLFPYSEVLYCSDPNVLSRHIEQVKLAVMHRQRTLGLLIGKHAKLPSSGIPIPSQTLFRSPTFTAQDLDKLYSELTLLPV